jgi:hypothetical protein
VKAGQGINAWAVTSQDSAKQPVPVDSMSLKEISEVASGKKQPKKKKRSDLANLSNPHHMTNCKHVCRSTLNIDRPSRSVSPHDDPYEPYPLQSSLLLPPPMRLLSARPQRKTAPLPGAAPVAQQVRPAEDDYICCFCEMALFFGSEKLRKRAIRSRRAELKRKEAIKTKAKNVAKGKGMFRDDDDDDDYDDDYEDDCQDGAGCGRCA